MEEAGEGFIPSGFNQKNPDCGKFYRTNDQQINWEGKRERGRDREKTLD